MHAKPGRSYDTRDPSASLPPGREAGRIPAVSTVTSHSRLVPPRNSPPPSPHPQPSKVSPSHSRSIPQFCIELEALLDGWEGILPLGLASEIKRLVNERLLPNKIRTTTEHLEKMKHPPDEHRKRSSSPVSWDPTEVANEKDRVSVSHEQSDSACRKTDTHHDQEPAVNSDPKKPAERDPLCRDHDETASCPPLAEVEDNRGSMRPSRSRNSGRFSDHPSIDTISKRFSGPLTEDNISWHLDTPEDDEDDFAVPGFAWRPNILY